MILRFLRAREFHLEKAREMLCHSLAWRKRLGIDRLKECYVPSEVIDKYYTGGWHYQDKGKYNTQKGGIVMIKVFVLQSRLVLSG